MSLRLKGLLIVFQISFLMWTIIIYAGYTLAISDAPRVDYLATASTQ